MFNERLALFKPENDQNTQNCRTVDEYEDVKDGAKGKGCNMAQSIQAYTTKYSSKDQ